jgi:hypothetical protein
MSTQRMLTYIDHCAKEAGLHVVNIIQNNNIKIRVAGPSGRTGLIVIGVSARDEERTKMQIRKDIKRLRSEVK